MRCVFCGEDIKADDDGWNCSECLAFSYLDYDENNKTMNIYALDDDDNWACPIGCLFVLKSEIVLDSGELHPIQVVEGD